jgi:mono/diheme cytochrome c family protein
MVVWQRTNPMIPMNTRYILMSATVLALALGAASLLRLSVHAAPAPADEGARVALGRHLVRDVALCGDCHSPRLPTGAFDENRWLLGAPIPFQPTIDMPWAFAAPPIAGLQGFTDDQLVALLKTGARPDGSRPLPPMPAFKLTEEEARAVVAYLRALPVTP